MLANTWTFTIKELKSFFNSPVAYVILSLFLLIWGWLFSLDLFLNNQAELRNLFSFVIPVSYLFLMPALTMRLIAEERKSGTLELLVTLPVRESEIILGKFFASLLFLGVVLLMTFAYPMTVASLGDPDGGAILGGYFGLLLVGATYLSIGLFTSSLTQNQIVAFITGFVLILVFFMLDKIVFFVPGPVATIFEHLSTTFHLENISRGIIDTRDLIYFAGMIVTFLFLTVRSLESRRWR